MKLKPYLQYRPSRIEWIEEIPETWKEKRFCYLFSFNKGLSITKENLQDEGVPCISYGEVHTKYGFEVNPEKHELKCVDQSYVDYSHNSLLKHGDFIFADTSEDIKGSGNFTYYSGKVVAFAGYHTIIARPTKNNECRYLAYLFDSFPFRAQIQSAVDGTKVYSISRPILRDAFVVLPTIAEQQAIISFLDRETGRIDKLIIRKEQLIERLKEKRTAMILRAVTKGLNPNVRLKPSGVEWLGDVPEHWEVNKLSWLFWYSKGLNAATLTKEYVGSNSGDFPVYSGQTENDGLMGMIDSYEFDFTSPVILVTTVGAKAMTTRLLLGKFSLSQNCALIIPRGNKVNSHYYESLLQPLFDYEKRSISLIMQPSLRFEDLNRFRVPLPPKDEQKTIADYLAQETIKIDGLFDKVSQAIEKLKEYRTAIISAAVTGKIDVKGESYALSKD